MRFSCVVSIQIVPDNLSRKREITKPFRKKDVIFPVSGTEKKRVPNPLQRHFLMIVKILRLFREECGWPGTPVIYFALPVEVSRVCIPENLNFSREDTMLSPSKNQGPPSLGLQKKCNFEIFYFA